MSSAIQVILGGVLGIFLGDGLFQLSQGDSLIWGNLAKLWRHRR